MADPTPTPAAAAGGATLPARRLRRRRWQVPAATGRRRSLAAAAALSLVAGGLAAAAAVAGVARAAPAAGASAAGAATAAGAPGAAGSHAAAAGGGGAAGGPAVRSLQSVWERGSRPLLPHGSALGTGVRSKVADALSGVALAGGGGGRGVATPGGESAGRVAGEANIAYFIQVSDSTLTLVPRLLRVLHHPLNVYVLHFDRKIPTWQVDHAVSELRANGAYTNVHLLESELVTYRGISMVLNTLNAIDLLTSLRASHPWDYMINLSGADYPLVSPLNQRRLLGADAVRGVGRNFLQIAPRTFWAEAKLWRYDRLFIDTSLGFGSSNSTLIDSGAAQPLASQLQYEFVAAESWMILTADFCGYLLHAPAARRMLMAFGFAAEPEEHYFATLLWNTPAYNETAVRHSLRHVIWVHNGRHGGQHPYTVDARGGGGSGGAEWSFWRRIRRSPAFFIRKMAVANSGLMDLIDAEKSGVAAAPDAEAVEQSLAAARAAFACVVGLRPEQEADACITDPDDGAPAASAAERVATAARFQRRRWSHGLAPEGGGGGG